MSRFNPYEVLEVAAQATPAEIKQAYRRLAKQFHPDSQNEQANHEQITQVNAAYELLKDPTRRQAYDYGQRYGANSDPAIQSPFRRQQRTQETQNRHRRDRQTRSGADAHFQDWVKRVYTPVNRELTKIQRQLKVELSALSADPFDDELMAAFQTYLEDSRTTVDRIQSLFRSMPNPATVAGVAAHLYYCLNHMEDGLREFEFFTQCYDDSYLSAGREMFRLAASLRREAQAALKALQAVL